MSSTGAVASPHVLATAAGEDALAHGGSAVDAAIATAAVLAVVLPHQCGIGGDAVALTATPGGVITRHQGAGRAASEVDVDEVRRVSEGLMPLFGVHTVTVPGAVSTWAAMHEEGGRLTWAQLFEPAVGLATDGFGVGPGLHRAIGANLARVDADPVLRELLLRDRVPLHEGARLRQPALAQTLTTIAAGGADAYYRGPIAAALAAHLHSLGSSLTVDDFARHRCDTGAPLESSWQGTRLWTAPPPSQGVVLFDILAAIAALDGQPDLLGTDAGLLAEIFASATLRRESLLADPQHAAVDTDAWPDAPLPTVQRQRPDGDTVAIVAADADGGFVSLIFSLFHSFGSGIADPVTGLILHNRGAGFSLDPRSPNCLAQDKRPAHSLMPLLLGLDEKVFAAHGTMGGYGQPQIHAQLLLRIAAGQQPGPALAEPRWVVGRPDDGGPLRAYVERSVPDTARESIAAHGLPIHALPDLDAEVGHAQLVRRTVGDGLVSASDPRAEGARRE